MRIWDGNQDFINIVDMGAYEYGAEPAMVIYDTVIPSSSRIANDGQLEITIENGIGLFSLSLTDNNSFSLSRYNLEQGTIVIGELKTGTYYLTVTDSNGDIYTKNIFVNYIDNRKFTIEGTVKYNSIDIESGVVLAYRVNNKNYTLSYIAYIEDGIYKFDEMDSARFILQAIPDPYRYDYVIPEFYSEAYYWQDAHIISVFGRVYDVDFNLKKSEHTLYTGNNITGLVLYENAELKNGLYDSNWFNQDNYNINNENLAGNIVVIVLFNNEPVAWSISSVYGEFSINDLPYNNYRLIVQYPGFIMGNSPEIKLNTEYCCSNITALIRKKDIVIYTEDQVLENDDINIYPNPFKNDLHLEINYIKSTNFGLTVYDLSGKKLYEEDFTKQEYITEYSVGLEMLASGIYQVVISTYFFEKNFTVVKLR